jgi:hypothetical protein
MAHMSFFVFFKFVHAFKMNYCDFMRATTSCLVIWVRTIFVNCLDVLISFTCSDQNLDSML